MKKILVAEDNPANMELLREVLESHGYEVIEAVNGREALSQADKFSPDLMLMDIQMPLLDGFGTLLEIRSKPRFAAVQVFALTAYAMESDQTKVLAAGFNDYVTKPIDFSGLMGKVAQALASGIDD